MFEKTLLPDTLNAIKIVSRSKTIGQAYLAGGTALALHLGHRISVDLDFFTQNSFDEQVLNLELSQFPEYKETRLAWQTVLGTVGETKFSIFYYKYKMIDDLSDYMGIKLAGKKDIAAMKILALSDRGTKRDFVDIYFLSKEFALEEMFDFYNQKFGDLDNKIYHFVKSLNYFADADIDKMPNMLLPVDWDNVKTFFERETVRLAKKYL